MDKDKSRLPKSIYPEPTRGPLAENPQFNKAPRQHHLRRFHDQSPATVLAMICIPVVLLGVLGFAFFYRATESRNKTDPREAAAIIARKISEMQNSSAHALTTEKINQTFNNCKTTPKLIVTHEYKTGLNRPTAYTHISLRENMDISEAVGKIAEQSDQTESNNADITCN